MLSRFINDFISLNNNVLKKIHEINFPYLILNYPDKFFYNNLPKLKGEYLRILVYFLKIISYFTIRLDCISKCSKCDILFFSGSFNQYKCLSKIYCRISTKYKCEFIVKKNFREAYNISSSCIYFKLCIKDIVYVVILFLYRIKQVHNDLLNINKRLLNSGIDQFLMVHPYIIYSNRLLKKTKPKFIVLSNDHSVFNRCLIVLSNVYNIKTIYIQHAPISVYYPKLLFDYAFLDGENSLEMYSELKNNDSLEISNIIKPHIFLSGFIQKSYISHSINSKFDYGIAINKLDPLDNVVNFINEINLNKKSFSLRLHPAMNKSSFKNKLKRKLLLTHSKSEIHSAYDKPIDIFFSSVNSLISGSSAIHLEAAIFGIKSYICSFGSSKFIDTYNFTTKGLCPRIECFGDLEKIQKFYCADNNRNEALKFYSSTYNTQWFRHEERLIEKTLLSLMISEDKNCIYQKYQNKYFLNCWIPKN